MRLAILALTLIALVACERQEAARPAQTPTPAATPPSVRPPLAAETGGALAPEALFFVGRWAAEAGMCDDPWVITAKELTTPAHVVCRFEQVSRTAQGVQAQAQCTAEGPPQPRRLSFVYAQSARALMIEGGPFNDVGLVRCPGGAYPVPTPPEPGQPGALPDDRTPISEARSPPGSPQAAAGVLERYFAALAQRDYAAAWRSWDEGGPERPESADALARSLEGFDSYNALIGAPGAAEGAAGSLYVRVPVQIYARLKDGREVHRLGSATLRRVNDVPGSTAVQRSWRIYEMEFDEPLGPSR